MNTPKYSQYFVSKASDMVNFGVGQPETNRLPIEFFKSALIDIASSLDDTDKEVLQYSQISGYERFRTKLANWLNENNYSEYDVCSDELFITQGATGALQLLMNKFIKENDTVLVEEPTYFLAIKMFEEFGCNVIGVKMNEDGVDTTDLENKIKQVLKTQDDVHFYCIPTSHNPTSITLSEHKRSELSLLANKYPNFYIFADETYHFLEWGNNLLAPMAEYHKNFISIGSFSKIIAPSLRVGWIYQNKEVSPDLDVIKELSTMSCLDSSGGNSVLGCLILENAIDSGFLTNILKQNIELLKSRCNALSSTLKELGFEFVHPTGGYFIWLNLGENNQYDYKKLLDFNISNKVKYHNGDKFSISNNFKNYARLSFSFYNEEDLQLGAIRLRENLINFYKIKVGVFGYKGKLGSKIYNNLLTSDKYSVYKIDNDNNNLLDTALENKPLDIIIDVTSPTGTFELINQLFKKSIKVKLLIGTTGHNSRQINFMRKYAKKNQVAVHLISNFSNGIPLFKKFIENIENKDEWKFKMVEYHHIHKKDKPSGTAKMLASKIGEIEIDSVREGEIFGEHKLIFENGDELMEIVHKAKNRDLFANGAIKYISNVMKSNEFYTDYELSNLNKVEFKIYNASGNILMIIEGVIDNNNERENLVLYFNKLYPKVDGYLFINDYEYYENDLNCIWEYYNKDGNKVNFCGNGLRTITYYHLKNSDINMVFNSLAGFYDKEKSLVKSQMPTPIKISDGYYDVMLKIIDYIEDELLFKMKINNILEYKTGVEHLIIELREDVYSMKDDYFETISQMIYNYYQENIDYNGININMININLSESKINIRTFERGVFRETGSCGSGCTSALKYYVDKFKDNDNQGLQNYKVSFKVKSGEKLYGYFNTDILSHHNYYLEGNVNEIQDY
jgi:2-aminoadipate transaminase